MFACRSLDPGVDPEYGLAHLQAARATRGYWVQHMHSACYEGAHARAYVPSAAVLLACLSLGTPLLSFLLLRSRRGELGDVRVRKVGGSRVGASGGQHAEG